MPESTKSQTVITVPVKSVGISLILTFFFGPLGMLYSTIWGGIIMFITTIITVIIGSLTLGFGFLGLWIIWPICIIWGVLAAHLHNKKSLTGSVSSLSPTIKPIVSHFTTLKLNRMVVAGLIIGIVLFSVVMIKIFGDSPEKAAKEWLNAVKSVDNGKIAERTCKANQSNLKSTGQWLSGLSSLGNLLGSEVLFSDMKFTTTDKSGETAYVHVTGTIHFTVLLLFSNTDSFNETWRMVKEDGKWKWCGQK